MWFGRLKEENDFFTCRNSNPGLPSPQHFHFCDNAISHNELVLGLDYQQRSKVCLHKHRWKGNHVEESRVTRVVEKPLQEHSECYKFGCSIAKFRVCNSNEDRRKGNGM